MYILVFHVPASHLEVVKDAVFAAGAGVMDDYGRCSWEVLGQGQFFPMEGANPAIGERGTLTRLPEYRVEMVVSQEVVVEVVEALLATHPYEVPSYHLVPVMTLEQGVFEDF